MVGPRRNSHHGVVRPGGVVVVAVGISRFASLIDGLKRRSLDDAFNAGLVDVSLFAVEEPSWIVEDPADLDNQLFAARAIESEPTLMGATSHIMMVGHRAESD